MLDTELDVSVDELEQELIAAEMLISRLRAHQARALRALDVRQVFQADGARSAQEWVRGRLDVSDTTARDLVHAARHFPEQLETAQMADSGDASFDRVVATSRLVASGAEPEMVADSFRYDINGVERLRHRRRRMTPQNEADVFANRMVYTQDSLDGTQGRTVLDLPGYEHLIFHKALASRADMFNDLPGPSIPKSQRLADAAVSIAQDSLDGYEVAEPSPQSDPVASVLVDATAAGATHGEAGAEVEYGHRIGPLTLEKILCVGKVRVIGLANGKPIMFSNGARAIPPAVRSYVAWRDGGCTVDGCRSRYRLQPHHIRHRADGGRDDPENLASLCWFHHHVVVHGMGLGIDPDSPPQRRRFLEAYRPGPDPPNG